MAALIPHNQFSYGGVLWLKMKWLRETKFQSCSCGKNLFSNGEAAS
jgi:hypothetical protein